MTEENLEIRTEIEALQKLYSNDPRQDSFNALILGESGSGKSFLLRTCRKPVHIDSFDPGGTKGLREYIDRGEIIVDSRYEGENPMKPSMFELWIKEMEKREKMHYFDAIGTYCLDSSTTWAEAIMNWVMNKAHLSGTAPRFTHDYVPQKIQIRNWLRELLDIPCDFILTGHLEGFRDEVSGAMSYRYMTTGKGVVTIPLLFDEIYVLDPKDSSKGVDYRLLTQSTGKYVARSRLAKNGLIDKYEACDIKVILKKAKLRTDDKPLFKVI